MLENPARFIYARVARVSYPLRAEGAMRRWIILLSCLLVIIVAEPGGRYQPQSPGPSQDANAQASPTDSRNEKTVKSYTLTPEQYKKAVEYSKAQYRLHFVGVAYSLALFVLILGFGLAPRLRNRAEALSRRPIVRAMIFVPVFMLTLELLGLPLSLYGHHLAREYGISIQGWPSWFLDWAKALAINLIISSFLLYALYGLIRRSPRRWWLYAGLGTLPLIIFFIFLKPLVIDPLFNRFEPLEKTRPQLVTEIEKIVARAGQDIPRERVFEMNASEKVSAVNAYVTGFGSSKRIVLWDTTIEKMQTPETMFVVGHEMGHYVLGHVFKTIAFIAALILLVAFLVYLSVKWALARFWRRLDIRRTEDWASLPVLMFFFTLFMFLSEPAFNNFSRYQEHEADIYGVEVIHGVVERPNEAAAEAFQKLGEIDLADPNPSEFIKFWLYSHPPLAERLEFARDYDPWSKGESPMFVK